MAKKSKFKEGDWVTDTWWPEYGTARVIKVLKTRIHVKFSDKSEHTVYDRPHEQFLEQWKGAKHGKNKRR